MTTDTADTAAPPPAPAAATYDLFPPRGGPYCAPLREGPVWERVLRCVLAALVAGFFVWQVVTWIQQPTRVNGGVLYAPLLNDVATGRVVTIDDTRDGYVLWRLRDGSVYADRTYGDHFDVRASVAAQDYVRQNPAAIRFARIDRPDPYKGDNTSSPARVLLGAAFLLMLVTGPRPRHATRWAWFWLSGTGVGIVAYLLVAGSRRRVVDVAPQRIKGSHAFGVAVVAAVLLFAATPSRGYRDGGDYLPGTAPVVERSA